MNVEGAFPPSPAQTLVITTLAEYQTVFWAPLCETLMRRGIDVFVFAFDDRSADMLGARGVPHARMPALAPDAEHADPGAFEKRIAAYGIDNANLLFSHERITFGIRDSVRLRQRFMRYSDAVERALDGLVREGKRPLVLQELGGFISVLATYFGARRRGIDNWFIEPAFFRGRLFFLKNSFRAYDISGPVAEHISPEVSSYLAETLKRRAIVIPKKDRHQYTPLIGKIFNARNARRLVEKIIDKHVLGKHQDFSHIGAYVRGHLKMVANAYRARDLYQRLEETGPFVYYPLHVPADVALTLRAPAYLDQLALVDFLLRTVPPTHSVAIKEHPAQVGALPADRMKALAQRYDNLVILPPSTNNFSVLERCDAVVSVNSKSGAEAMLLGRPVLVLGDSFYANCPFVKRVASLQDVPAALRAILGSAAPNAGDVAGYFQTVYERSYPGELYVPDPENVATFAETIEGALGLCATAQAPSVQKRVG